MNGVNATRVRPGFTDTVTETFNHTLLTNRNVRDRDTITMNYQVGGVSTFGRGKLDPDLLTPGWNQGEPTWR